MTFKTIKPGIIESIVAGSNLLKHRFVGFDGNYCVADAKALGISDVDSNSGEMCPVVLSGIMLVESAGVIAVGDPLASSGTGADAGRAVKATVLAVTSAITSSVEAGATPVTSTAANGEVVTSTSVNTVAGGVLPQAINGYALDTASGAGEFIRVKLV